MDLAKLKAGKRGAVARAISTVENDPVRAREIIDYIFPQTGDASIIGFTGPAGSGKSTLINLVATELIKRNKNPAVLAVDPTSHISGGAILGDRVRMTESTDSGIYIRSVASRGATGAVSESLRNSIRVLDYAGFDPVIIESVGAGQTEVEISNVADVIMVLFSPQTGDGIQAIKAGLSEIGDIYIVNKSDLAGASRLYDTVCDHIGADTDRLVLQTSAKTESGIAALVDGIIKLTDKTSDANPRKVVDRFDAELRNAILNNIKHQVESMLATGTMYQQYLDMVLDRKMSPFEAADRITEELMK